MQIRNDTSLVLEIDETYSYQGVAPLIQASRPEHTHATSMPGMDKLYHRWAFALDSKRKTTKTVVNRLSCA
jgi:hypothetical protein